MQTENNSEILHYKRGIYYIDKLINLFPNKMYNKQIEKEFSEKEVYRFKGSSIGNFDLNNFMFLCTVSLLGLNKEAIESSDNLKNYNYNIDYSKIDTKNFPTELLNYINKFQNTRSTNSNYDEWLSINNLTNLPNFNYNYLFNVRNALMHSEYNFDLLGYIPMIANIKNGNYTHFSAKIFIPKYYEFIKHYFGNDKFFGIVQNLYAYNVLDENPSITNEKDLLDYITNKLEIIKLDYDNKLKSNRILEKTLLSNNNKITEYDMKKHGINSTNINLSNEDVNQIILAIKGYYGDKFYELSISDKITTIITSIKFRLDPKSVISSWILHFYRLTSGIMQNIHYDDKFYSMFAMYPTLLILKSYLILYRIQNKELSNYNIDYNLVNEFNFGYEANYYNDYKLNLINKGVIVDEDEYKTRYFSEVFRDSLAHGNVSIFYKDENNIITQYFKFTDKWKTTERNISISIDDLQKFLSSECFNSKYLTNQTQKNLIK